MRKLTLLLVFGCFTLLSFGQLSISSGQGKIYDSFGGTDFYVVIFNGINSAQLEYNGTETTVEWFKFDDSQASNQIYFSPDNATGYYLKNTTTNDILLSVWVIDYNEYLPVFNSFVVDESAENQCEETKLILDATIAPITYKTSATDIEKTIKRKYTISYSTLEWNNEQWNLVEKTQEIEEQERKIEIEEPPLCDTQFTLKADDEYTVALGITPAEIKTDTYTAVAVACKVTSITSIRSEKNEADRPETSDKLSGSAPLDILFKANPTDAVNHNEWTIYKNNELLVKRNTEEYRYSFTEMGQYKVVITSTNTFCTAKDSVIVDVSESALWIPNAFSPNGDGLNDEFRVAYRSLASFECWVYNRWGRRVYYSNNPLKGWDGTIGGKPAAAAPYFYVIKAVGTDGKKYQRKGDINLLR